jgi:hypothetical protein
MDNEPLLLRGEMRGFWPLRPLSPAAPQREHCGLKVAPTRRCNDCTRNPKSKRLCMSPSTSGTNMPPHTGNPWKACAASVLEDVEKTLGPSPWLVRDLLHFSCRNRRGSSAHMRALSAT